MEESFCGLILQQGTYLQKIQKICASFIRVNDTLHAFNISGSLVDQVTLLARIATRKEKYMASTRVTQSSTKESLSAVQRDLEVLRLENASLTQRLTECSTGSLTTILESFKNLLQ